MRETGFTMSHHKLSIHQKLLYLSWVARLIVLVHQFSVHRPTHCQGMIKFART